MRLEFRYHDKLVMVSRNVFVLWGVLWLGAILTPAWGERMVKVPLADGFEIPVGKPAGEGYYVFRGYAPNGHLGEDWNGKGGGDTDLGDPVYACADGIVVFSYDVRVGWGHVVIIRHAYRDTDGSSRQVDSLYAHLDRRSVRKDQIVRRGQQIGTIGTAHGRYAAHLHFEMRKNLQVGMNRSQFPRDFSVYYSPRQFIASRGALKGGGMASIAIDTFGRYAGSGASPDKSADAAGSGGPAREIPTRETAAIGRADELKKKLDQLDQLVDKNKRNAEALTDEDIDGFWDRLKTRLKNGKSTTSGEGQKP
jgi:Peptidase family M23